MVCMSALRTRIASGLSISEAISYCSRGNPSKANHAILFRVWILNMVMLPLCLAVHSLRGGILSITYERLAPKMHMQLPRNGIAGIRGMIAVLGATWPRGPGTLLNFPVAFAHVLVRQPDLQGNTWYRRGHVAPERRSFANARDSHPRQLHVHFGARRSVGYRTGCLRRSE